MNHSLLAAQTLYTLIVKEQVHMGLLVSDLLRRFPQVNQRYPQLSLTWVGRYLKNFCMRFGNTPHSVNVRSYVDHYGVTRHVYYYGTKTIPEL